MSYFSSARTIRLQFSAARRRERMAAFIDTLDIRGGERVLDLGGTPNYWRHCPHPLDITVLNLPGTQPPAPDDSIHSFTLVAGDATDVAGTPDQSYDIVFSNSVIEHVGDADARRRFAGEVRRLAPKYWVQTPSIWFPMEAHTHLPFWWFYPRPLKERFHRSWKKSRPAWEEMIRGTDVVSRRELSEIFPDAAIDTERYLGFAKSYLVHRG